MKLSVAAAGGVSSALRDFLLPDIDVNAAQLDNLNDHPLFDVTRANVKTYWNASGQLAQMSANELRVDYDPLTNARIGWRIEEPIDNECNDPTDWTTAEWESSNGTCTVADDGLEQVGELNDMYKIIESNTNDQQWYNQPSATNTLPTGGELVISVYAKAAERSIFLIGGAGLWASNQFPQFDVANGLDLSYGAGITTGMQELPNGVWRCWVKIDAPAGSAPFFIQMQDAAITDPETEVDGAYQGDGSSGMYFWGVQAEQNYRMSSFYPAAGTRNGDLVAASSMSFYNDQESTILAEGFTHKEATVNSRTNNAGLFNLFTDDVNNSRVALESDVGAIYQRGYDGAATGGLNLGNATGIDLSQKVKTAWFFDATSYGGAAEGSAVQRDTETFQNIGFTNLWLGSVFFNSDGRQYLDGVLSRFRYYSTKLTDPIIESAV